MCVFHLGANNAKRRMLLAVAGFSSNIQDGGARPAAIFLNNCCFWAKPSQWFREVEKWQIIQCWDFTVQHYRLNVCKPASYHSFSWRLLLWKLLNSPGKTKTTEGGTFSILARMPLCLIMSLICYFEDVSISFILKITQKAIFKSNKTISKNFPCFSSDVLCFLPASLWGWQCLSVSPPLWTRLKYLSNYWMGCHELLV